MDSRANPIAVWVLSFLCRRSLRVRHRRMIAPPALHTGCASLYLLTYTYTYTKQSRYDTDEVANATTTAAVGHAEVVASEATTCSDMAHVKQGKQQARAKHGRCDEHATTHGQSHKRRANDACTRDAAVTNTHSTQAATHIQHSCDTISIAPVQQRDDAGDSVEAASDELMQTTAVASAAVVNERCEVATARSSPGWSRGPELPATDSNNTCNEMSIPASPELLVKINKKNTWQYKKI